jgi:hypothetical protein
MLYVNHRARVFKSLPEARRANMSTCYPISQYGPRSDEPGSRDIPLRLVNEIPRMSVPGKA